MPYLTAPAPLPGVKSCPVVVTAHDMIPWVVPGYGGSAVARLYFAVALAYNCTESAIRIMHPVWILFLLATITVPAGWEQIKKKERARALTSQVGSQLTPCLEEV